MAWNGRKTAIYQSQILGIRLYVPDFARKLSSLTDATAILFYENFNQQDCFAKKNNKACQNQNNPSKKISTHCTGN